VTDEPKSSYQVGYKKPPRATQFRPGQSGNPTGRPKGSKSFATELTEELNERINIGENGRRKRITKRRAFAKQLINKALSGDLKAANLLLNKIETHDSSDLVDSGIPNDPSPLDQVDLSKLSIRELSELYRARIAELRQSSRTNR
jgi:hypothetical protein